MMIYSRHTYNALVLLLHLTESQPLEVFGNGFQHKKELYHVKAAARQKYSDRRKYYREFCDSDTPEAATVRKSAFHRLQHLKRMQNLFQVKMLRKERHDLTYFSDEFHFYGCVRAKARTLFR